MRLQVFSRLPLQPGSEVAIRMKSGRSIAGWYQVADGGVVVLKDDVYTHRAKPIYVDVEDIESVRIING